MTPYAGKCLCRTTLLGVERRQGCRYVEKVRRQRGICSPVAAAEAVHAGRVVVHAALPFRRQRDHGPLAPCEVANVNRATVHSSAARSQRDGISVGRWSYKSAERIDQQLYVRVRQQALQRRNSRRGWNRNRQSNRSGGRIVTVPLRAAEEE